MKHLVWLQQAQNAGKRFKFTKIKVWVLYTAFKQSFFGVCKYKVWSKPDHAITIVRLISKFI